jgi:glycosyltransferase involved in cell wall biosynthesis
MFEAMRSPRARDTSGVTKRPELSVLLPARDAGRYLRAAVDDLLRQRGVTLEVVAVDDGSSDGTGERLEAMARGDPRLRVVRTGGIGPARALDLALRSARHAWIGQMEADDRCPPDRFARLCEALRERSDWDGVVSRAGVFGFRGEGMRRYVLWQNGLVAPDELARARFVEIPALHQSGLYRRAALDAVGGFVGASEASAWPLDIDFWMRWFERGLRAGRVERVLYRWRQHARQSTRTSPAHRLETLRRCKAWYFARGPARARAVDLYSVGRTLEAWGRELGAAGVAAVRAHEWRPGAPLPAARREALRLFVYGMEPARARVRAAVADFDPARDWFAA